MKKEKSSVIKAGSSSSGQCNSSLILAINQTGKGKKIIFSLLSKTDNLRDLNSWSDWDRGGGDDKGGWDRGGWDRN